MKWHVSLKYRIAVTIFILEAIMLGFVLHLTLSASLEESHAQLVATDQVILHLLSDMSRVALLTEDIETL